MNGVTVGVLQIVVGVFLYKVKTVLQLPLILKSGFD